MKEFKHSFVLKKFRVENGNIGYALKRRLNKNFKVCESVIDQKSLPRMNVQNKRRVY